VILMKDALTIADLVNRGLYTEYNPPTAQFERLKTIMSDREYWVEQSIRHGNRIVRWIDLYFPEFRQLFPDWTAVRSLASLHAFPLPCDLHGLTVTVDDVIEGWRRQGMKRCSGVSGRAKAEELLRLAACSIGNRSALNEAKQDLQRLLKAYQDTLSDLEEIPAVGGSLIGRDSSGGATTYHPGFRDDTAGRNTRFRRRPSQLCAWTANPAPRGAQFG